MYSDLKFQIKFYHLLAKAYVNLFTLSYKFLFVY